MEYYSAIKRNKIELSVVRWMDLESVIPSEVSQKEKDKYNNDITHMWNLKYDTNELIYKAETESQISKTNLRLPKGKHGREG